jgi:hypothetical protein
MSDFIDIALSLPTAVYTVLLGVVALYWLMVVAGAFDIDFLDSVLGLEGADAASEGLLEGAGEGAAEGIMEGASDGAAEGLAEGASEGAAEGMLDGAADGAADGLADGAGEGAVETMGGGQSALASLLSFLSLKGVPITVSMSLLVVFSWLATFVAAFYLGDLLSGGARTALLAAIPLVAAIACLPITALSVRPMRGVFGKGAARRGQDTLVGAVCKVSTLTVDEKFGQAVVDDKGAGLTLSIRCDSPNLLTKGARALIISYDPENNVYFVEPYDAIMSSPSSAQSRSSSSAAPYAEEEESSEVGAHERS